MRLLLGAVPKARPGCSAGLRSSGSSLGHTPAEERDRDDGVQKIVSSTI